MHQGKKPPLLQAFATGGLALLVSGCSPWAPTPTNTTPPHTQPVIESVAHWQDVANKIAIRSKKAQLNTNTVQNRGTPYFVRSKGPDGPCASGGCPSNFQKTFQKLLTTALVRKGLPVTDDASTNNVIQYDVQLVGHNWSDIMTPHPFPSVDNPWEVLITASMKQNGQYLMRFSEVFYVRRGEGFQFQPKQQNGNQWPTQTYTIEDR